MKSRPAVSMNRAVKRSVAGRMDMRLSACVAAFSITLIQQPNTPLLELDAVLCKIAVHPLRAPSVVLRNDRDRDEIRAVQHNIIITGFWHKLGNLLLLHGIFLRQGQPPFPLRLVCHQSANHRLWIRQHLVDGVNAMFAA